ncbi:MAG: GC-type dockerin domain-anchored protein [Phycisphaerales bacterium JB060]
MPISVHALASTCWRTSVGVLLAILALASAAAAQPCDPTIEPGRFGIPGVDRFVAAAYTWDDGSGEALYVGGRFMVAGTLESRGLARWDGSAWSTIGDGPPDNDVDCIVSLEADAHQYLYVGGSFTSIGGMPASHIARWDGSSWSPLGDGLDGPVYAIAEFDDGTGPALYAGGWFTQAGGQPASGIAKWDGSQWTGVGGGVSGPEHPQIYDLKVFDDGAGPALFVAGNFSSAGSTVTQGIAKWDGDQWLPLGTGLIGVGARGATLEVFNDGSGEAMYLGGRFDFAGGVMASNIARWDGVTWSPVGPGLNNEVIDLEVHRYSVVPALFAAGRFRTTEDGATTLNHVAAWTGRTWEPLRDGDEPGLADRAFVLEVFEDDDGPAMFVGGNFSNDISGQALSFIGRWDDSGWSPLTRGIDAAVNALLEADLGAGARFFAGGEFNTIGDAKADHIAMWNGGRWTSLGIGLDGDVADIAKFVENGRTKLVVAGNFTRAGIVDANRIAVWDGSAWSAFGDGFDGWVNAVAIYDDGAGPAIYAGGSFSFSGSTRVERVTRWNGEAWVNVGSEFSGTVHDLIVFDDGSGPALYASGRLHSADGERLSGIARWDGTQWSDVGGGITGSPAIAYAMAIYDGPIGPRLIVAGEFEAAGGVPVKQIAAWDGSQWSPLGEGIDRTAFTTNRVYSLAVGDFGQGPMLFAGGDFGIAGSVTTRSLAWWDGSAWNGFDEGVRTAPVLAIAQSTVGGEQAVYIGGFFSHVDAVPSHHIAKLMCQPVTCRADFNNDGTLDLFDFLDFQSAFARGEPAADFDGDGALTLFDFLDFQSAFSRGC